MFEKTVLVDKKGYNIGMEQIDQKLNDALDIGDDQELNTDGVEESTPVSSRKSPRLVVRNTILKRLVARGIPDDMPSLTTAVNDTTEFALDVLLTDLVTLNDLAALERELTDRVEELSITNLETMRVLLEIGTTAELRGSLKTFKRIVEENRPKTKQNG